MADGSGNIWLWWRTMLALSTLNVGAATFCVYHCGGCVVAWLAWVYVLTCAFRSVLPRIDTTRLCLIETPLSTPLIGRSLATVAELCLVVLLGMCLVRATDQVNRISGTGLNAHGVARGVVALIVLAEVVSWVGCLTEYELWNAVEETMWTVGIATLVIYMAVLYSALGAAGGSAAAAQLRLMFGGSMLVGVAYIVFMVLVDVPMYVK